MDISPFYHLIHTGGIKASIRAIQPWGTLVYSASINASRHLCAGVIRGFSFQTARSDQQSRLYHLPDGWHGGVGFFAEIINRCTTIFIEYAGVLKKISFPRLCLPVIVGGSALLNHVLLLIATGVVFLFFGHFPGVAWVVLPIGMLVITAFALASVSCWASSTYLCAMSDKFSPL